jgi:cardiolipin synthase
VPGADGGSTPKRGVGPRLRAGLRRHGVIPRPVDLRRRLRAGDVRFTQGNAIELFPDGATGLAAMLDAIVAARRRIHLETYILRTDETGRRFLRALAERARAGVEVRVLFDGFGSLGLDSAALAELRASGADVVAFNPLGRFYPRWAPRRRDHRKILVVDGKVAFTGGLNIGDEYARGASFQGWARRPWRDAHVRVRGPAVPMLDAVFLESWFRADGPDRPWADAPELRPASIGKETVAVLPDGPTYHRRRLRDLLISALERSRRHVRLVTPYFLPGARLRDALAATAGRGVAVELLIAGYVDHPLVRWAAHGMLPHLLKRGVRVYEHERSMMHAKAAVFDESLAVLGTSNLDRQSLQYSYEVNLVFAGGSVPGRLSTLLREDMSASRPITEAELRRLPLYQRMRNRIAAALMTRL